jgi:nucleoid-associated protein YgaU
LTRITRQVLGQAWGRPATDAEIDPYWRALVAANRSRLPDPDNPDLVYPGEVLTVPPPPAEPTS